MKEEWLFIDTGESDPGFNMALDEALLQWVSQNQIPPVLRFYRWNPATLSLGYFQKVEKEINLEAVREQQLGLVRRLTGGRAVLHDQELTYSVIVPENHPRMPKTVTEAYRIISEGIRLGFQHLGINAYFAMPQSKEEKNALLKPNSAVCFETPSYYELVVDGKKIAGSAQTRQQGVILQHGSILLDIDIDKLFSCFKYSNEDYRERAKSKFLDHAVTIQSILKREVSIEEVSDAFMNGFAKGLEIELIPYRLTEDQLRQVQQIADERYNNEKWTFLR